MHLNDVIGIIIQKFYEEHLSSKLMSRHKLPCTRCKTMVSSTWRPGPCGTSSLCNTCGVKYMRRQGKPRMIDLVRDDSRTVWMERDANSFQWQETKEANKLDKRIQVWSSHEVERLEYIQSKKRKFVNL